MRGVQCAHELSRNAPRRGQGNEIQKAVQAEDQKDRARRLIERLCGDHREPFHFHLSDHSDSFLFVSCFRADHPQKTDLCSSPSDERVLQICRPQVLVRDSEIQENLAATLVMLDCFLDLEWLVCCRDWET